jgi:hypothetical protein
MKCSKLKCILLTILIAIILSSCNARYEALFPDFSTTYSVIIVNNRGGFSPTAPENRYYAIERSNDHSHFEGVARFSVGGNYDPHQATVIINIPEATIKDFLQKLSQSHPESGQYNPKIEWTDSKPEIIIRLVYGKTEMIEFSSTSQGEEHFPWQVTYKGKSYVINSGIPAQALKILNPYLSQDVFQNLINQVHR